VPDGSKVTPATPKWLAPGPNARNDEEYQAKVVASRARVEADEKMRYVADFARRVKEASAAHASIIAHAMDGVDQQLKEEMQDRREKQQKQEAEVRANNAIVEAGQSVAEHAALHAALRR
jgi:hypothetical protein